MTITRRNLLAAAATFAGAPLSQVAFAQEASSFLTSPFVSSCLTRPAYRLMCTCAGWPSR